MILTLSLPAAGVAADGAGTVAVVGVAGAAAGTTAAAVIMGVVTTGDNSSTAVKQ